AIGAENAACQHDPDQRRIRRRRVEELAAAAAMRVFHADDVGTRRLLARHEALLRMLSARLTRTSSPASPAAVWPGSAARCQPVANQTGNPRSEPVSTGRH